MLIVECDACGDDITEGIPHSCPVGGNIVTIESKEGDSQDQPSA